MTTQLSGLGLAASPAPSSTGAEGEAHLLDGNGNWIQAHLQVHPNALKVDRAFS